MIAITSMNNVASMISAIRAQGPKKPAPQTGLLEKVFSLSLLALCLGSTQLQALTAKNEQHGLVTQTNRHAAVKHPNEQHSSPATPASSTSSPAKSLSLAMHTTTRLPKPFWITQTQNLFEQDHPTRYSVGKYIIDQQLRFNENDINYEAEAKNAFESSKDAPSINNNDNQLLPDLFALMEASEAEPSPVVVSGQPDWTEILENQKLYITKLNLKILI